MISDPFLDIPPLANIDRAFTNIVKDVNSGISRSLSIFMRVKVFQCSQTQNLRLFRQFIRRIVRNRYTQRLFEFFPSALANIPCHT